MGQDSDSEPEQLDGPTSCTARGCVRHADSLPPTQQARQPRAEAEAVIDACQWAVHAVPRTMPCLLSVSSVTRRRTSQGRRRSRLHGGRTCGAAEQLVPAEQRSRAWHSGRMSQRPDCSRSRGRSIASEATSVPELGFSPSDVRFNQYQHCDVAMKFHVTARAGPHSKHE
eukprot:80409-Rhodomonas_salina.2